MREERKKQLIAVMLGITMFITLLCSSLFVIKELDHDCEGEHCTVCLSIELCVDLLKTAGGAVLIAFAAGSFSRLIKERVIVFEKNENRLSPVELKIRMNN